MTDEIVIDYDVLKAQFEEATQHLHSIRDYIRFGVSKINEYELTVAHGTTDPYAESAAMVLSVLSLGIEAHPEILQTDSARKNCGICCIGALWSVCHCHIY